MASVPVLSYWPTRGMVNPTRLLLEYVGQKYQFEAWAPMGSENDRWPEQKYQLGLPFPNLPYLKDGSTVLTQSLAIIRYFARKHDLVAHTEQEQQQQDVLDGVFSDVLDTWYKTMGTKTDFEVAKANYRSATSGPVLEQLEKHLSGKDFLIGTKLTYTDFLFFEWLDTNSKLFSDFLSQFTNLQSFHHRIANLKGVKEYLASDRLPKKINAPNAHWGG